MRGPPSLVPMGYAPAWRLKNCTHRACSTTTSSPLRGLTLAGHLSAARAQDLLADFDDLPIRRWASADPLRRRAFQLRDNVSAYDAAYVALAEALRCSLLSRDARLARSSGHTVRIEVH
ncbi:type II toxin-antitoxin system VapC family toxin [Cryobacterium aureum]|uniref:type II toxin-antitoxin system VapC family toxin n=1 Tax=Cryobacterium aureum TaxID=995037 RepID=UPI00196AC038|nr:type II toxin-antitoxin system VapC family toxin [Cryobacterium aureum]